MALFSTKSVLLFFLEDKNPRSIYKFNSTRTWNKHNKNAAIPEYKSAESANLVNVWPARGLQIKQYQSLVPAAGGTAVGLWNIHGRHPTISCRIQISSYVCCGGGGGWGRHTTNSLYRYIKGEWGFRGYFYCQPFRLVLRRSVLHSGLGNVGPFMVINFCVG